MCADAQAGLRLCCSQTPEDRLSHVEAHITDLSKDNQCIPIALSLPDDDNHKSEDKIDQIIWKNGSFRNRDYLLYKKTAILVLMSLLMRTNEKCSNLHAPSIRLGGILLSVRTQYS